MFRAWASKIYCLVCIYIQYTQGRRDQQTQMCCERERNRNNIPFTSAIFVMCAGTSSPSQIAGYRIILPEKRSYEEEEENKKSYSHSSLVTNLETKFFLFLKDLLGDALGHPGWIRKKEYL